ncbi:hypothetical protein GQ457_04G019180 [Hibiscus cannabinus]
MPKSKPNSPFWSETQTPSTDHWRSSSPESPSRDWRNRGYSRPSLTQVNKPDSKLFVTKSKAPRFKNGTPKLVKDMVGDHGRLSRWLLAAVECAGVAG